MKIEIRTSLLFLKRSALQFITRRYIFFLLTTVVSFPTESLLSQKVGITINSNKTVVVEEVLDMIDRQTEYSFVYQSDLFENLPSFSLNKGEVHLDKLLHSILPVNNFDFTINENDTISIWQKPEENLQSSQKTITGKITNVDGEPLPGSNVVEKGTTNGTQSDFDGNFSITVADENAILAISYVGFTTIEVQLNGQSELNIVLNESATGLEEAVVIGYGTQRRSDLTGSVASVSSEEVQALTISNPTLALQGRVAGVNVQSNGGAPGAPVSVIVRGAGTINGSLDPLYVVDGVFLENLSSVNPNDVESIEVLKDASAAAIYGSRAANGVVIVTTAKGSGEGLVIRGHATGGISTVTNKIDFLNARQYADVRNAIDDASNAPRAPANDSEFNPNVDTDWQDLSLQTGIIQDYGFIIANTGGNASVYFSANYFQEKGVLISSDFNRTNLRLNSEYWSTNRKIRLSQSLALTQRNINKNEDYGITGYDLPTIPLLDDNGDFVAPSNSDHGIAFGRNRYARAVTLDDDTRIDEVFGNVAGEIEFLPGLKYRLNLGLNYASQIGYLFAPTFFWSESNQSDNQNKDADLTETRGTKFDALVDNIISYNREIGKHSINAILGNSVQKITNRFTSVIASRFPSNDLRVLSAAEQVDVFSGEETVTGLFSYYGRFIYDYDDKYFLTGTFRRDDSSRFSEDFRTGYFPSASVGWRVSNEDFFNRDGIISNLKLRLSYGQLGSQNLEDYAFTPVIHLNSNYDFGDQRFFGVSRTQFRLNNLVWERSITTNFGLDAGLLNGRLNITTDYFIRNTDDILLSLAIPQTSGSTQPVVSNAASIENKGIELNFNYRSNERKFKYDINLNLTSSSNEITSLGELDSPLVGGIFSTEGLQGTRAIVGEQLGVFWGFETDGLYQNQSEIDNDPNLSNSPGQKAVLKPGDFVYVDRNEDGIINNDDKFNIGNPYPDFEYGINFNGSYENFEFTIFIESQVGNEILNGNKYNLSFESRSNYSTDVLNAWTPSNTRTNFPVVGTTRFDVSDFYIEDGSYLRLKQLRLGYNLPNLFNRHTNAKIFLNAQNLLTLTGYSGYDPEVGIPGNSGGPSAGGPALLTRGVDLTVYPQSLQISAGVQLTIK